MIELESRVFPGIRCHFLRRIRIRDLMIELESRVFPVFAVEELNECLIILIPAISCHLLQRMIEDLRVFPVFVVSYYEELCTRIPEV
jgi:hypothetical protein